MRHKPCEACRWHIGAGCCRINMEDECGDSSRATQRIASATSPRRNLENSRGAAETCAQAQRFQCVKGGGYELWEPCREEERPEIETPAHRWTRRIVIGMLIFELGCIAGRFLLPVLLEVVR